MSAISILIVDDEESVRHSLFNWFREDGYEVGIAKDAYEALAALERSHWDIMLLDIRMPGMDGMELQRRMREVNKEIIIIIMTAYASVDTAVSSLKEGAYDYIVKPFNPDDLSHMIRNAAEQLNLRHENIELKQSLQQVALSDEIIGESPQIRRVMELVQTVAQSDSTVVIRGESGTGKELIARAIHTHSERRYHPIIAVNCGALAESLLESELFGHEKGAFTGAQMRRKGKFEMADKGTLFLDEIGNISQKMQMELLRVLESRQFTRVGGNQTIHVDIRLICATNKNLEMAVADGSFREDLYYRINVFTIGLPPLRERKSDIPLLAYHFINKYNQSMNKSIKDISPQAMDLLIRHQWPGNVRELENAIERAMVVGKPPAIQPHDLPFQLAEEVPERLESSDSLAEMEKHHIALILRKANWNISRSARILGIDRVTLYNKIKKYQLKE
ncbi:MAG TPA: sigma-54 dependent transcriptional regulator [bacterium]|nr:sigma-54 dependent transcriptional regulator [bacterium]HPR87229.1 sigma-54 dependent transcriptional regulator [bacterium]